MCFFCLKKYFYILGDYEVIWLKMNYKWLSRLYFRCRRYFNKMYKRVMKMMYWKYVWEEFYMLRVFCMCL